MATPSSPSLDPDNFKWETGQILATSQPGYDESTFLFEMATGSLFGHVGMVVVKGGGEVVVYESTPGGGMVVPAQSSGADGVIQEAYSHDGVVETPLKDFLKRSTQTVVEGELNCSEFVHKIFSTAGVVLSKLEKKRRFEYGRPSGGFGAKV